MNKEKHLFGEAAISDNIISHMTIKDVLEHWLSRIASNVRFCLYKYYIETKNIDVGDKKIVVSFFKDTYNSIETTTPILEDMLIKEISGIEDIFIAVYGVISDEVYALRHFLDLYKRIDTWDEDYMWNDCVGNQRLKNIIL